MSDAFELPAILVDRVCCNLTDTFIRLSFGEHNPAGKIVEWRVSLILGHEQARALAKLLQKGLTEVAEQMRQGGTVQ